MWSWSCSCGLSAVRTLCAYDDWCVHRQTFFFYLPNSAQVDRKIFVLAWSDLLGMVFLSDLPFREAPLAWGVTTALTRRMHRAATASAGPLLHRDVP